MFSPPFFLRDNRVSETWAHVKITPREKRRHTWGDFHTRSHFAHSTIPEEKWGTTRSLPGVNCTNISCQQRFIGLNIRHQWLCLMSRFISQVGWVWLSYSTYLWNDSWVHNLSQSRFMLIHFPRSIPSIHKIMLSCGMKMFPVVSLCNRTTD